MAVTRKDKADAIRVLSMDAVQQANSGHPGMPMGMADIAEVLWSNFLNHNPNNPNWMNRDRFILSNGHGSMLIYALLHLTGYPLPIAEIKNFRKLHSATPGHPEYGETVGVETTTGPLGQGLANAVGMAMAQKHLASRFNRPSYPIIDHFIYCFVGDGDLMEGISHEAASLAGTFGLNKLIVFYDDNGISIDGEVSNWFTDDTPRRFEAYHWNVIPNVDGHDSAAIAAAVNQAHLNAQTTGKPTLICCKTTIGFGAPTKGGTAETHGAALGEQEVMRVRERLGWTHPPFVIPEEIYNAWDARTRGDALEKEWNVMFAAYVATYPDLAAELMRRKANQLPKNWQTTSADFLHECSTKVEAMATRKASQFCLNHFANQLEEMFGGSADLTESNCTNWKGMEVFSRHKPEGRYVHYGVREFGMSAVMNGIALYGGLLPFGGTFLTFSDYARNALRLSALMRTRVVFVYSHDSIGLGEDGPTHQPVEQLPGLRLMPHLAVWRPCDLTETFFAWQFAIEHQGPTCMLLSRQALPQQTREASQLPLIARGGYILKDFAENRLPDAILIATGSEVALAMQAALALKAENIFVRVVSMPEANLYLQQNETYRNEVLPKEVIARVAIEAAASNYWYQFVGLDGGIIGLDRFGASAPAKDVFQACGFNVAHVVAITKEVIYAAQSKAQYSQQQKCAS